MKIEGRTWLAQNLRYPLAGSECDIGKEKHMGYEPCELGKLYTWSLAKRACQSLGEGWRLPTDKEFSELFLYFGGYMARTNEVIGSPEESYLAVIDPQNGFNSVSSDTYWTSDLAPITEISNTYLYLSLSFIANPGDQFG